MRRGLVFLWALIATVVLIAAGIVGVMFANGKFAPTSVTTAQPIVTETAEPVLDTSYSVLVLNATPQDGLATQISAEVVAAGWSENDVTAGDAGSHDFETTTVFYANAEDEGAARGLAEAIGGAPVELSDAYQDSEDSSLQQLVIVIGADRETE